MPAANSLNYFPPGKRYGLLAVSGWGTADSGHKGTTLVVLDSADCWREVKRVGVSPRHLAKKRTELLAWMREQNWADGLADRQA